MQPVNQKPKICSKEWLESELRCSNRELKKLRKKVVYEERERESAQEALFKISSENLHLINQNEFLKNQVKNLSELPKQLKKVIEENKKLADMHGFSEMTKLKFSFFGTPEVQMFRYQYSGKKRWTVFLLPTVMEDMFAS